MKKLLYNLFASQSEASLDDSNHILESGKFQQKKGAPNNTTTACVMGSGATNNGQPSPTRSRSNATIALTTTTMTTAIVEALEEGCEMNKERTVVRKLMNCNRQAVALGEERLSMWARMLYHLDEMKYQLFHPHIETTSQLMSMLDGLQCMGDVRCRGNNNNNGSNGSEESVIATVFDDMKPDMERIKNEHELSFFQVTDKVRVRFLLAEAASLGQTKNQTIRKLLSPIKTSLSQGEGEQPQMLTSALVIGPWYLEWDSNSSLCIPRRIVSDAANLVTNGWQIGHLDLDFVLNSILPVISQWNTEKVYDNETANGQHFVDDLIKALGFPQALDTSSSMMGDYLSTIRSKGYYDMSLQLTDEMKSMCGVESHSHCFQSHEQLDAMYYRLLESEPMFIEDNPIEGMLLLMLDRVFWQRHIDSPENPNFRPTCEHLGCPFRDPRLAVTMRRKYFS